MTKRIEVKENLISELLNSDEVREKGYVILYPESPKTTENIERAVECFNILASKTVFVFKKSTAGDFLLSYLPTYKHDLLITYDDYSFYDIIDSLDDSEDHKNIKVNMLLKGLAERYCIKKKIAHSFDYNTGLMLIRQKGKKSNVFRNIEKEVLTESGIYFASNKEINLATARVYCSMLNSNSTAKIKCKAVGPDVVIYGRNLDELTEIEYDVRHKLFLLKNSMSLIDFQKLFNNLKDKYYNAETIVSTEKVVAKSIKENITEPAPFVHTLYGKPVSREEYNKAERWQRLGFASQYNWENEIEGDVDMCPKDVRLEDYDDDEVVEVPKYDWSSLEKDDEEHESNERKLDDDIEDKLLEIDDIKNDELYDDSDDF